MKLIEALEILRRPVSGSAPEMRVHLACGFMPLHLRTFLSASLRDQFPDHRVDVASGRFGDLAGNLDRLDISKINSLAVCVEWADLDPRLGVRTLGGWRPGDLEDIVHSARKAAERLQIAVAASGERIRTAV